MSFDSDLCFGMGRVLIEAEFEMLYDDEVIPKYAAEIVIGRVKG